MASPLPPPRPAFHFSSSPSSPQTSDSSLSSGSPYQSHPGGPGSNPFDSDPSLNPTPHNAAPAAHNGSDYFGKGGYTAPAQQGGGAYAEPYTPGQEGHFLGYNGERNGGGSVTSSAVGGGAGGGAKRRRRVQKPFEGHLLDRSVGVPKPWLKGPSSKPHRLSYSLFLFGIIVGLGAGAYMIYSGYAELPRDSYCQVLDESFGGGVDSNFWQKEQELGGTNVGDFTWFTDSDQNIFVQDGKLHLMPTLTTDTEGTDLTQSVQLGDACTSTIEEDCNVQGNDDEIIPPIKSGMLSTRGKVNIKYGRVEITAKMPTGDWIWPRISLVPADNVYGEYPASGQIDIFQTRGNLAKKRSDQLNNEFSCGLHWGPDHTTDRFSLSQGLYKLYRLFFNDQFYTFGVDWNEDQVFVWINSRVRKAFNLNFQKKTFFDRGKFPVAFANGSLINNPWLNAENQFRAPFDQDFYLRLSVAAGGTDGFWSEDLGKPWKNDNKRGVAMKSFHDRQSDWYPTWPTGDKLNDRAMIVDSVKMWQKGSCK